MVLTYQELGTAQGFRAGPTQWPPFPTDPSPTGTPPPHLLPGTCQGWGTFPDGSSVHSVNCWVGGLGDRSPQPSFPSRAKVGAGCCCLGPWGGLL